MLLIRNCPMCGRIINYTSKGGHLTATKNNTNCRKCVYFNNRLEIINRKYKKCVKCKKYKKLFYYYKNVSRPDGLCHMCKKCDNAIRVKRANFQYSNDIQFKIANILRSRIHNAIKNRKCKVAGRTIIELGCSITYLIEHIESQFYPHPTNGKNMSWDNWKLNGWHIDHIIPLCSFDLTDKKQFSAACNYKNLQPLWAEENLKKGGKI